jgi:type II secretion system protein J
MGDRRLSVRAFTLLEVLLATAMMAVLAGSLYASLSVAFKARRSASAAVDPVRTCTLAMNLVGEDLQSAVAPNGVLAGTFLGEHGTDAAGRASDALTFYCVASDVAPSEGVGDVERVEFACRPSEDASGQVLVRRVTTNLLSPQDVEPRQEVLCRGVFAFTLTYFNGSDWTETWNSDTEDNRIPAAVEVTLRLESNPPGAPDGGYRLSRIFTILCGASDSNTIQAVGAAP